VSLLSRRTLLAGSSVAGVAALAACGAEDETTEGSTGSASSTSASEGTTTATLFGEVEVPADPQNIVALGWGDMEAVPALGGQVLGTSDWLAFGGDGVGPWAQDLVTQTPEQLGTLELNYEAIAALAPDVILNTRQSNDQAQQDSLAQIAPTVGPTPDVAITYGTSWRDQVELVAAALGKTDEGATPISDLEAKFAEANPTFTGRTVAVAAYFTASRGAYVTGDSFFAALSEEQLDQLEADLVVVFPIGVTAEEITAQAGIQNLQAQGRSHRGVRRHHAGQRLLQCHHAGPGLRPRQRGAPVRRRARRSSPLT